MAFPSGALGLMPWMNARESGQPQSGIISFSFGADIVFKWVQDGTPSYDFPIYANGRYGTDGTDVDHYPWVWIVGSYPGTPDNTPADRTALEALTAVEGESAQVTSDSSWWMGMRKGLDVFWVPMRTRTSLGTTTAWSITADVYTATVPVADLPKYQGVERIAGGYYDLCWNGNNKHAPQYDGQLFISPTGIQLHDNIFQRTEFNTRTAGEKALFPDEFITGGQVEGGHNITINFRTIAGALTGYGTVAAKGANLVIEARSNVRWRDEFTVLNYEDSAITLTFQDWPRLHEEPEDSILPINFYVETVGTESVVKGYAHNNNLYVSHTALSTVNDYPMDDAGFIVDSTVNHLRFVDTANGTWNISGTRMPTQTPEGIIYRKGILIEFTPTGASGMTKWTIGDDAATTFDITDSETVYFEGNNGVATTVTDLGGGDYRLLIDRPLTIKENDVPVSDGPPSTDTVHINFRDDGLRNECDPVPWTPSPVDVTDRAVTPDPNTINGQRDVRHYFPAAHGIYSTRWFCDYNAASTARSIGYMGGAVVNTLMVGVNGFVGETTGYESIVDDPAFFTETYMQTAGIAQASVLQARALPVILDFTGTYLVDVTIEGIVGLNIPAGSAYNPVIHPALHMYIMNTLDPNKANGMTESCGCHNIFDFINPAGVPIAVYAQVFNSRPWSIKGQAIVNIGTGGTGGNIFAMLSYNPGTGENRFVYQITHMSTRITKLAGQMDYWTQGNLLTASPGPVLAQQAPINFHNQTFNGV